MLKYSNISFLVLFFLLSDCFIVYPIREEILDTKVLSSGEQEKIQDVIQIKHEFQNKTLWITIEESTERVTVRTDRIQERKKILYDYGKSEAYRQISSDDKPWNRDILGMFADIAALFELITIPFRIIPSTREQTMDRESIIFSENKEPSTREPVVLILRADNSEILNRKMESQTIRIPLSEIRKIFPKVYQVEVLVYRKQERVSYKVIQLYEAMYDLKN